MDRHDLQTLNESFTYRFAGLDRRVSDIKSLAVSLDRRIRSQRSQSSGLTGRDRFVKHALLRLCGDGGDAEQTYRERFKSVTNAGSTAVPEWAGVLSAGDTMDFLLAGATPSLLARLLPLGLNIGTGWPLKIPYRTDDTPLGGWTPEGAPAGVGSAALGTFTPLVRKLMAISVFSRELRKHSNPQIENVLDIFLRNDINQIVDTALLDDAASSISRPAGILNGVAATAPGASLTDDLKALAGAIISAGGTSVVFIVNPVTAIDFASLPGTLAYSVLDTPHVPAGRIIALDPLGFAGSLSAAELQTSETATVHLDSTALPIVDGTGVAATQVTSLWQTGRIGISAILDVGWAVAPDRVAYIDQVSP